MQEVVRRCDKKIGSKGNSCGDVVEEPISFNFDGVGYEADLCEKHTEDFRKDMEKWTSISQPTTTRAGTAVRKALKGKGGEVFTTKDVRRWLQEQGMEVSPSGRLSNDLIEQYKQAHQPASRR